MKKFDAVIVGAGPSGGQCARELSKSGYHVLLIDKAKSFLGNNYSSGGAPLEILSRYNLPESIVGSFWNTLRIDSTHSKAEWTSPSPLGPIIDFEKLREFLSSEACRNGGELRLGCQYRGHQAVPDGSVVQLKDVNSEEIFSVHASVLVDATGSERKVMASQGYPTDKAIAATGIEYHVQVSPEIYRRYAHAMHFFLGHRWMPQGYAWIFPMSENKLKVGIIRYFQDKHYVPYESSYKPYMQAMLDLCSPCEVLDKHGKTIYYTPKQKDCRQRGSLIALGDAISSINPLGWEGIRHALASGSFAAQAIRSYLSREAKDLSAYDRDMRRYFGIKWRLSEKMIAHLFTAKRDAWMDQAVECFSLMNTDQIMQVVFDYRFRRTLKSFICYIFRRMFKKR